MKSRRTPSLSPVLLYLAVYLSSVIGTAATRPAPSPATDPPIEVPAAASPPAGTKGTHGRLLIVVFEEPPLARFLAQRKHPGATEPSSRLQLRPDIGSTESRHYMERLETIQRERLSTIERALDRRVEMVYRYRAGTNGIAIVADKAEARRIEQVPGVKRVIADRLARLHTDVGPPWIGAEPVWDGSASPDPALGEGTIVGIIDTGIHAMHPSFAATGGDGYVHVNPLGNGVFLGWCDGLNPHFDPDFACNNKLIGAWDFADAYCAANPRDCSEKDGPADNDGHGSHTSSTAAGNILDLTNDGSRDISGVAPHANLIMYDACFFDSRQETSFCPLSATVAAADQALLDGVDVLNFSIGGGTDPWGDDIDAFLLQNVVAGTFVAASAGNAGPEPGTVEHLAPWVTSVAASTHDRDISQGAQTGIENRLANMTGGIAPPSGSILGNSRTGGSGTRPIVLAGDYFNGDPNPEQCLHPFPPGTWTNQIVLCDRGGLSRVLKCQNVADGGAQGCVLANASGTTDALAADAHLIPAIHVDAAAGDTLRAWLAGCRNCAARITPAAVVHDPAQADVVPDFSSRGPNPRFDVLKPDVAAPGYLIYGAVDDAQLDEPGLTFRGMDMSWLTGTSMASPHTAGAAALLRSVHPDWTPLEIKSALMMTAAIDLTLADGRQPADPWDRGAGRLDLSRAVRVGLVLEESGPAFEAADPLLGGSPETLNLPSLQQMTCVLECNWQRVFRSPGQDSQAPGAAGTRWTVASSSASGVHIAANPSSFQVVAGDAVTVAFAASAPDANPGDPPAFAQVTLTPDDGGPPLRLPVVIQMSADNFPTNILFTGDDRSGTGQLEGLQYYQAIPALTLKAHGMTEGIETMLELEEDPTQAAPYDDLSQVYWMTLDVASGTQRIVALTESVESADVDLFLGTGNSPSAASEVCRSSTTTASEYCQLLEPPPGEYWVLVQNWEASNAAPDRIALITGIVPTASAANLMASGPQVIPAGAAFEIAVSWAPDVTSTPYWFGALSAARNTDAAPFATVGIDLEIRSVFVDGFEIGSTDAWHVAKP
jgi:subtilisin family serine protease